MKVCWSASSASSIDPEHVAAEAEDAAVVAVVEHLEGRSRAVADVRDEALVGRDAQQHVRAGGAERARDRVKAAEVSIYGPSSTATPDIASGACGMIRG